MGVMSELLNEIKEKDPEKYDRIMNGAKMESEIRDEEKQVKQSEYFESFIASSSLMDFILNMKGDENG